MKQADRMNSASNEWEADPWDATGAVADAQLEGFRQRADIIVTWARLNEVASMPFGVEKQKLVEADVAFVATTEDEDMLLMQLDWHGFPDPPEWRLATRLVGGSGKWQSWGYFATIPQKWRLPENSSFHPQ